MERKKWDASIEISGFVSSSANKASGGFSRPTSASGVQRCFQGLGRPRTSRPSLRAARSLLLYIKHTASLCGCSLGETRRRRRCDARTLHFWSARTEPTSLQGSFSESHRERNVHRSRSITRRHARNVKKVTIELQIDWDAIASRQLTLRQDTPVHFAAGGSQ